MSNQIKRDPDNTVNNSTAYEKGYHQGRHSERLVQEDNYAVRDNNSAASGIVIGLALAVIAGLAGGAMYLYNQRQESPRQTAPSTQIIPVPVPNNSQPQQAPSSNKETTIIERTIDKTRDIVPVPTQPSAAPSPQAPSKAPSASPSNINITIPAPQQPSTEDKSSDKASPSQSQTNGATNGATSGSSNSDR